MGKHLSVLKLNSGHFFVLTGDTWASFGTAYHRGNEDPHSLFAEMIGEDRETAREIAYRMMYTNYAIKLVLDSRGDVKCQK